MNLRPEREFVKALFPRPLNLPGYDQGPDMNSSDETTALLRLAQWQMQRRATGRRWPRRVVALAGASAVVMGSGVAFAAWTSTGSGTAVAKAGTISFTVTGTAPAVPASNFNTAHPGSVAGGAADTLGGDLAVTITNNSGFTVKATAIQQNGLVTATGGTGGTCPSDTGTFPASVTMGSDAYVGALVTGSPSYAAYNLATPVTIPTGTNTITLPNVVGMTTASPSVCQTATLSVPVIVTAGS